MPSRRLPWCSRSAACCSPCSCGRWRSRPGGGGSGGHPTPYLPEPTGGDHVLVPERRLSSRSLGRGGERTRADDLTVVSGGAVGRAASPVHDASGVPAPAHQPVLSPGFTNPRSALTGLAEDLASHDSRVRAGIDMDGSTHARIPARGLSRPFLFLAKQANYTPGGEGAVTTWERDWNLLTGWKRWLLVAGA